MRSFCEIGCAAGTDKCRSHGFHVHYERHLGPLRQRRFTLFEIGIWEGGSLRLWEEYFPLARVATLDANPECQKFSSTRSHVYAGDQADGALLGMIALEEGGFDVVIDDACHVGEKQKASYFALFPHIRPGGYYVIEDLETAYYESHGGGPFGTPGTGMALVRSILDDVHARYHKQPLFSPAPVASVHLYPNIVFIERA